MNKNKVLYKCICGNESAKQYVTCPKCNKVGEYKEFIKNKFYKIPQKSKKRIEQDNSINKQIEDKKLEEWFSYHLFFVNENSCCQNCNQNVFWLKNKTYKKSLCAHILPKNIFTSVKYNKDNFMLLCLTCHSAYDYSWGSARKMKVWEYAKKSIDRLAQKMNTAERIRLQGIMNVLKKNSTI